MNGYDATKGIRKFDTEIPIVCMSADVYEDDVVYAKKAGMNYFIKKPIDKKDIEKYLLKTTKYIRKTESKNKKNNKKIKEIALSFLSEKFDNETSLSLLSSALKSIDKYTSYLCVQIQAKDNKNQADILDSLHALKGVLLNVGLRKQVEVVLEIERQYQDNDIKIAKKNIKYLVKSLLI